MSKDNTEIKVDNKKDKKVKSEIKAPLKKTSIGGQALIEGIMMVGPERTSMAVRKGDGTIYIEEIKQSDRVTFFEKVPFIRGCIRFYKMLVKGTDALMKSADISEEGLPEKELKEGEEPPKKSALDEFAEKHYNFMLITSVVLGIAISVGLFLLLPWLITYLVNKLVAGFIEVPTWMPIVLNIAEGVLRIFIFFIYLRLASKVEGIGRVWRYHGAEHKTIACYEAGEPLTVENIKKHSRFHPRCGTAFMFIVMAISILVYTVAGIIIGSDSGLTNFLIRIIFIPIICGISFEILKFVGKNDDKPFFHSLSKPGLWLQKFTTAEPDDSMIEVAIAAMQAVIPENSEDDIW